MTDRNVRLRPRERGTTARSPKGCPPKCPGEAGDEGGPTALWSVYVIQSLAFPKETYVGVSTNVFQRLGAHNAGDNRSTRRYRPWRLLAFTTFPSQTKAEAFERYLKSGSGRAFRKRHLE